MHPDILRKKFRDFFNNRNHVEIPSGSLVPSSDDPTVLFTTAGMQPLVPNLMGAPHAKGNRLFDTQKCFRANDIEEVGDDTHHTFFEMLGNWSLGDYFKQEAIDLAYDFFVQELKLDPNRFAITIFQGDTDAPKDEEAKKLWLAKEGISEKQIYEFDKTDNFWGPAGATGPCGPCSEIHYDRGEEYGEDLGPNVDDNQRYVEIWNLVFMEYSKTESGGYEKLEQKNVDTGAGFERLLAILNKKDSAFDTPLFTEILQKISDISGKTYQQKKRAFRIISDHLRASVFTISDGVSPGNEGRNYVLRNILRRAIRQGKQIGITAPFIQEVAGIVIDQYQEQYPELLERKKTILQTMRVEEEGFQKTLKNGEKKLEEMISESSEKVLSGEDSFRLFDTYGFPLDLTKDIVAEAGMTVDEPGFEKAMKQQRERSKNAGSEKFERNAAIAHFAQTTATEFCGDTNQEKTTSSEILEIFTEGGVVVVATKKSPFYAEGGGQVGDTGAIVGKSGTLYVSDTQKTASGVFLHQGSLEGGFKKGDKVKLSIDEDRRKDITRHHSLAHLFLMAAQKVLGAEVHQAGSHVDGRRMRFDFTFPRALDPREIIAIEQGISQAVFAMLPVTIAQKPIAEAKAEGVEAMFGEKYGDIVRTVKMGEVSYELCGGTHIQNTVEIGAVKFLSESGVAAGVRRVEVVCGRAAEKYLQEQCAHLQQISKKLKSGENQILDRLETMMKHEKEQKQVVVTLQKKMAELEAASWESSAREVLGKKVLVKIGVSLDAKSLSSAVNALSQKGIDRILLTNMQGNFALFDASGEAKDFFEVLKKSFGGGGGGRETMVSGGGMQIEIASEEEVWKILS